mmetsp:Transcript_5080/g.21724  ORF Transcript_5080/g.21724 Transcript_5080/m.21724 type:complete len:210 (-) Transcript_5080:158-787(-)
MNATQPRTAERTRIATCKAAVPLRIPARTRRRQPVAPPAAVTMPRTAIAASSRDDTPSSSATSSAAEDVAVDAASLRNIHDTRYHSRSCPGSRHVSASASAWSASPVVAPNRATRTARHGKRAALRQEQPPLAPASCSGGRGRSGPEQQHPHAPDRQPAGRGPQPKPCTTHAGRGGPGRWMVRCGKVTRSAPQAQKAPMPTMGSICSSQ